MGCNQELHLCYWADMNPVFHGSVPYSAFCPGAPFTTKQTITFAPQISQWKKQILLTR